MSDAILLIDYLFSTREETSGLKLFSDGKVEIIESSPVRGLYCDGDTKRTIDVFNMLPSRVETLVQKLENAGFFKFRSDYSPSFMLMSDFYEEITLNKTGRSKTVRCHGRRPENDIYDDVVGELRNYMALLK